MEKLNVIRTDKETSEQELVTLDYAIEKLTGFLVENFTFQLLPIPEIN